ncbi:MAG: hypothetical protein HY282_16090 [Nitrospirae bacterium]|nr:hypothetical protein [Candidatus Manganitrophaceae bacterium]
MRRMQPIVTVFFITALWMSGGPHAFGQTTPGDAGGGGTGPLPQGSAPGVGVDQDQRGGIRCPPGASDPLGKRQESPGLKEIPPNSSSRGTTPSCPPDIAGIGAGSGATGGIVGTGPSNNGSNNNGAAGNGSAGGGTAGSGNSGGGVPGGPAGGGRAGGTDR